VLEGQVERGLTKLLDELSGVRFVARGCQLVMNGQAHVVSLESIVQRSGQFVTHEVPLAAPPRRAGRGSERDWPVAIHALEGDRRAPSQPSRRAGYGQPRAFGRARGQRRLTAGLPARGLAAVTGQDGLRGLRGLPQRPMALPLGEPRGQNAPAANLARGRHGFGAAATATA